MRESISSHVQYWPCAGSCLGAAGGTATYRIMDNLIVEASEQFDEDALMQQLGLG